MQQLSRDAPTERRGIAPWRRVARFLMSRSGMNSLSTVLIGSLAAALVGGCSGSECGGGTLFGLCASDAAPGMPAAPRRRSAAHGRHDRAGGGGQPRVHAVEPRPGAIAVTGLSRTA